MHRWRDLLLAGTSVTLAATASPALAGPRTELLSVSSSGGVGNGFSDKGTGACQVTIPKFSPQSLCETVERECVSHTILVPTMINLLTQFTDLKQYDLSSLEYLGYGGSPIAPP